MKVTKTGFSYKQLGDFCREYEWSSKSPINSLSALFNRQLSCHLTPDPLHLEQFGEMCNRYWENFFSDSIVIDLKQTFSEWIDSKTEWSIEKRKKYFKTYLGQRYGKLHKYIGNFKTMVKSGEVYTAYDIEKNEKGFALDLDSRPRNICIPDDSS